MLVQHNLSASGVLFIWTAYFFHWDKPLWCASCTVKNFVGLYGTLHKKPIAELRSVTCPTQSQVNAFRLNPMEPDKPVL